MLIRKYFLLFWFFVCFYSFENISAQKNYVEVLLTTSNGTLLEGWVDYRNWQENPQEIQFRETPNSKTTTFTPKDIIEIRLSEARYRSATVEIEQSSRNLDYRSSH